MGRGEGLGKGETELESEHEKLKTGENLSQNAIADYLPAGSL